MTEHLKKEIMLAYIRKGHKSVELIINLAADDCLEWLNKYARGMTEKDITEAFKRGARDNEYGLTNSVCSESCIMWLKGYLKGHPAKSELQRPTINVKYQVEAKTTITEAEQSKIDFAWIERCKERFKRSGSYLDMGNVLYNSLCRQNLLNVNDELIERATELVLIDEQNEIKSQFYKAEIGKNKMETLLLAIVGQDKREWIMQRKIVEIWLRENV